MLVTWHWGGTEDSALGALPPNGQLRLISEPEVQWETPLKKNRMTAPDVWPPHPLIHTYTGTHTHTCECTHTQTLHDTQEVYYLKSQYNYGKRLLVQKLWKFELNLSPTCCVVLPKTPSPARPGLCSLNLIKKQDVHKALFRRPSTFWSLESPECSYICSKHSKDHRSKAAFCWAW